MGTTDANGIYMYADTDPLVPFASLLNTGQASVSAKFASIDPGTVHYVANVSERTALASTYLPTASKPLYVHRANVTDGRFLEVTTDGTNWTSVASYQKVTVANWANLTSNTTTAVNIPALATTVPVVAGTTYSIEFALNTYSPGGSNDLVNMYVFVNGTQLAVQSANASNAIGTTFTARNSIKVFYTATSTTTITINARFSRGSGSGTVTTNNASGSAYGPGFLEVRSV